MAQYMACVGKFSMYLKIVFAVKCPINVSYVKWVMLYSNLPYSYCFSVCSINLGGREYWNLQ